MDKTFTKGLFYLLLLPLLIITAAASAQTITVGAIDPGPYGRGSSITLPFHIDNTSGCIATNNTFKLVLSDANGIFPATPTVLTTKTGFYETFLNGTIPLTIPAGTGYRLRIESTSAGISLPSNPFTISVTGGVIANVSSQSINPGNPDVFGACIGTNNNSYPFINNSTAGASVNATFFNEITQAFEGGSQPIPVNFIAKLANYSVTVKANKGGVIGTKSYTLINNDVYRAIGNSGSNTACANGGVPLTFPIPGDDGSGNGFKYNYPGLLYTVNWGDGSALEVYTYCDIVKQNNSIGHLFTASSCGNNIGNQRNVFKVELTPINQLCGSTPVTPGLAFAKVISPPKNIISGPENACTNTEVIFTNGSDPGEDANSPGPGCKNIGALYTWYINDVPVALNQKVTDPFVYKFLTHGSYKVTLRLQNPNGCPALDRNFQICIQDKPVPKFDIPPLRCLSDGSLTPIDNSILDNSTCNTTLPTYNWKLVSGPANGVTFNATATLPQFNFTKIGVYQFQLEITSSSCGPQLSPLKTIVVNTTPSANLLPSAPLCGKGVTLSFDPTAGPTKTTFDGTAQPLATTYTWAVTSPDGGTFSFTPGSNANTQYPRIVFNDYATYNVSVTHTNNCGTITKTEQLTFSQSPTVSAGPPQPFVCEDSQVTLAGTPGVGGLVTAVRWTSPTANAAAFSSPNAPNTIYTPTAADIANGQVLLTYTATTSLGAPCNSIASTVLITIIKKATVTSANNPSICSGGNFNYTITAANQATTFTWTATVTSGTATGFSATGSGNTINDLITNNSNTDAVITYTILPRLNGCDGTPFLLRLTVHLLPVITATPVDLEICSNLPANITLTSNIAVTTYAWESTTSNPAITGNTTRIVPSDAPVGIQDILVNNSGVTGTVTYKITPYNGTCPGPFKIVTRTIKPAPKTPLPGQDEPVCAQTEYQLHGNDPSPGVGKWTLASNQAGVTFSNQNDPNAKALGLQPGQVYQFKWEITSADCPPKSAIVTITNNAQALGGTTAGTTTVCAGTGGQVTLTGQVGTIVWQQSTNGGLNWVNVAPAQTAATLTYPPLTQTTQYRALVTNGSCAPVTSTVSTITVVPATPAANAGTYTPLCDQTSTTLTANDPGTFVGKWEPVGVPNANILIETPNNFQTLVTGLSPGNTYQFKWTIFAKSPCTDNSISVATIIVGSVVMPNFTSATQVCGSGAVSFTNTSTPDLPGTVYEWNFGDGSPVSHDKNPSHSFQPNANKTDATRTVSLTITSNCNPLLPKKADIIVSPETPDAHLKPPTDLRSCGDLNLSVENASLGTNDEYTFHLVDENGVDVVPPVPKPRGDKSAAVFQTAHPTHIAIWHLYVEAKNNCDVKRSSDPFDVPVSPSDITPIMQIKDGITSVCLGTPVIFMNRSINGDTFKYTIYDGNGAFITDFFGGPGDFSYIFPGVGKYKVSITASSAACSGSESGKFDIEVIPLPQPDFLPNVDIDNNATFVNLTPDAGSTPNTSLIYQWNFGDGSPVDPHFTPAKHFYNYENSPYTVTLTATIPGNNCSDIKVETIEIKFTGELFLPNAFQPAATETELRTFKAKGQKLKEWRMQIFNNWGQLIWQTTALNSNGEPTEGWDGTFKGVPAQQGVYIWQVTARFLNGSDWKGMSYKGSLPKRSGTINLIR